MYAKCEKSKYDFDPNTLCYLSFPRCSDCPKTNRIRYFPSAAAAIRLTTYQIRNIFYLAPRVVGSARHGVKPFREPTFAIYATIMCAYFAHPTFAMAGASAHIYHFTSSAFCGAQSSQMPLNAILQYAM